jgi:DNA-binding NarL/FixJ family response regulator
MSRVVIAEDNALLREGLTHVLRRYDHEVVAAVADAEALLTAVADHHPDVAVIDVRMPPTHTDEGLRAALRLRRDHPEVALLVLSQYVETHYAAQLLAGSYEGVGYLLKDRVAFVSEFLDALTRVANGGTALDPEVVSQIVNTSRQRSTLDILTGREREVLALMAEGRSNQGIAEALHLSYATVEKHITNIFGKLHLPPSDSDHRRVLAVLRYIQA